MKLKIKEALGMDLEDLAEIFMEMLEDNEEHMGECAAFSVTCSQLEIDEEDGYELMRIASEQE